LHQRFQKAFSPSRSILPDAQTHTQTASVNPAGIGAQFVDGLKRTSLIRKEWFILWNLFPHLKGLSGMKKLAREKKDLRIVFYV